MKPPELAMKNSNSHTRSTAAIALVLVIGLILLPAQAQEAASPASQGQWKELIAEEGDWTRVLTGAAVPSALADVDLAALDKTEWKELCSEITETVRTGKDAVWERAVQDLIYLAVFYTDEVHFGRANLPLFYDYVLGRNEQHRIMALAAMHAIGDYNTMAQLGQRIRLERSPRVQRLAAAAVVDYFAPSVEVGQPRRADR